MKQGSARIRLAMAAMVLATVIAAGAPSALRAGDSFLPAPRFDSLQPLFGPRPVGVLNAAVGFQIRIGGWLPQTRTNAKIDDPGESRVNFTNLSADPQDIIPALDLGVTFLHSHKLRLGYWDSTQEGKTTLGSALTFDGTTFPGATNVKSTVELSVIKAGYEFMLLDGEWLKLGAGVGLDIVSTKEQIQATGAPLSGKHDDSLYLPFVSGTAQITFGGFTLFANLDVMDVGKFYYFDGRAGAMFGFDIPPQGGVLTTGLGVDWRIWDAMVDYGNLNAEWTQQGLEVYVFARF